MSEEKTKKDDSFSGEFVYAVGRRKESIAIVRFFPKGKGRFTVNEKDWKKYFPVLVWQNSIEQPLKIVKDAKKGDFSVIVRGGGTRGQAEAVQLGIARALAKASPDVKNSLRAGGLLTRDARIKERKKYGLKRARRGPQFSKR